MKFLEFAMLLLELCQIAERLSCGLCLLLCDGDDAVEPTRSVALFIWLHGETPGDNPACMCVWLAYIE